MLETLLKALAARTDRALELQTGLTSFPAFGPDNGGPGEWDKAAWLEARLLAWGVTHIERVDADDARVPSGKRPNMIVRVPGASSRTLWVLGHLDVVPPGDASLWRSDPWVVTRDPENPDIIRGRGVEDNQQALVAGALVAAELTERGITPDLGFGLIAVADEETGNRYGAEHVLKELPDLIAPDDLVLVPDFGTADGTLIEVAEKGTLWLRVTVTGVQCHASTPDEGKNALIAASSMILRVHEVEERFNARDPLFTPPRSTMVPTRHDVNVPNVNTIPGKDVFFIDCRVLPAYSVDEVLDAFRSLAAESAARYGVAVDVEVVSREPAAPPTPVDSEVVTRLKDGIRRIYGLECRAGGIGGGTVARLLRRRGIPAAVWSRVLDNAHVPNEAARLSNAVNDARVYSTLLFTSQAL
ncbi:MAG: M20 family metallo-hydrolase [Desulfovibrionaceae bacterium]|nr:M20 family metallo-hydrolase [Desulfovibrionaceae bacterium]